MHNQTNGLRSDDDAEDSDMVDDDEGITEDDSGIGCWATATEDGIVLEEEDDDQDEDMQHISREYTEIEVEENYCLSEEDKHLESEFPKFKRFLEFDEFRAFIGLWYLRGPYCQATTRLSNLYKVDSLPVFSAVMPRKRYLCC